MADNTLREKLLRLAQEKPELRAHLVPLLREGAEEKPFNTQEALAKALRAFPGIKFKSFKNKMSVTFGDLNPEVDRVEFTKLDTTTPIFKMILKNGQSGWGWDGFRQPKPVFHDTHNTLQVTRVLKQPDPQREMVAFVNHYLLEGVRRAGQVWVPALQKTVPLSEIEKKDKPAKKPERLKELPKAPAPESPSEDILEKLKGINLGPAGRARSIDPEGPSTWSIEPANRQRLDHYVGTNHFSEDEDEDGWDEEGWDEEGWENDYANPVRRAAEKWLSENFGPNLFSVDVGEKGHVHVELSSQGKAKFSLK